LDNFNISILNSETTTFFMETSKLLTNYTIGRVYYQNKAHVPANIHHFKISGDSTTHLERIVTSADLDYPVEALWFTWSRRIVNHLTSQSYLMTVIPETCHVHEIRYLCFFLFFFFFSKFWRFQYQLGKDCNLSWIWVSCLSPLVYSLPKNCK